MSDMLSRQDRSIALLRNLQNWPWDIYPKFTLEREDIRIAIPILKNHIVYHTTPKEDNKFMEFYDELMEVNSSDRPSYKADQSEGEILQTVLGDFL